MNDKDARYRIIKETMDILDEVSDVEKITVRQIAERAQVGVGLVNYHFHSKDKLLSLVIAEYMAKMVTQYATNNSHSALKPEEKLKSMLQELYNYAEQHESLLRFTITQNLINGEMQTPLFLIPVLKEIFGSKKTELQLRVIALQILLPIQVTSLNTVQFHLYSGIDLRNATQRNAFIDSLVDNVCN